MIRNEELSPKFGDYKDSPDESKNEKNSLQEQADELEKLRRVQRELDKINQDLDRINDFQGCAFLKNIVDKHESTLNSMRSDDRNSEAFSSRYLQPRDASTAGLQKESQEDFFCEKDLRPPQNQPQKFRETQPRPGDQSNSQNKIDFSHLLQDFNLKKEMEVRPDPNLYPDHHLQQPSSEAEPGYRYFGDKRPSVMDLYKNRVQSRQAG